MTCPTNASDSRLTLPQRVRLGTLAKVPFGVDEYTCAGGLLREALRLVR